MNYFEIAKGFRIIVVIVILFVNSNEIGNKKARKFASLFVLFLFHRHFLVIAQVDALWQMGDVCTYKLAVESVNPVGI